MDRLIVYGNGFSFGVKEPAGWVAETAEVARQLQVNVVFFPADVGPKPGAVNIRVRVNKKVDEHTEEDLKYDLAQYRKEFPNAQFVDLQTNHREYRTFSKLVYETDRFYEYVAYVNPGTMSPFVFSVGMSNRHNPASDSELKAFETVLQSLVWLTTNVQTK